MSWLIQLEILLPAMLAGCLILASHVPLGRVILNKGIIFADLAVAQVAVFGVILLQVTFGLQDSSLNSHLWPATLAIAASTLLYGIRKHNPQLQEALIGSLFMLASTGVIILLSSDPHGGEKLKAMMAGQILWLTYDDLGLLAGITILLPILWFAISKLNREFAFYPVFAIAVTIAAQLVGVYVVFASLIIPALTIKMLKTNLVLAFFVGFLGYLTGLILSSIYDLPSGATICWSLAFIGFLLVIGKIVLGSVAVS